MDNPFLPMGSFVGFLVPHAMDASLCASLLEGVMARGFSATGLRYPDDYRNNDRLVFDDPSLAQALFDALAKELPAELVMDGARWQLSGLNPRFRACRYQHGQGFCIHRDGPHVPSDEVRSLLTVQLYLDDAPGRVGGHTRFYSDARGTTTWASIPPTVGSAIVFDHRVWHDGEAVTQGIKHVLRTDAMYRRIAEEGACSDSREMLGKHRGYAWKVIVRANGDLASAGRDGTVRTWGASPEVTDLGSGSVTALYEVNGRLWAGTRSGSLVILEDGGFQEVATLEGAVLSLAYESTETSVVASTASGALVAFDEDGARRWTSQGHAGWAWCGTPYRDGMVSVGHDGRVRFTTREGVTSTLAELGFPLRAVAASGEQLWLGDVRGGLHRLEPEELVASVQAHEGAITSIAVAKDGSVVTSGEDAFVKQWRGPTMIRSVASGDFVTSVVLTDRDEIVCAGYDGTIWMIR